MTAPTLSNRQRYGDLLRTNRLAVLVEIVVVFLPFYVALIINDGIGTDHITLWGDAVVLQGPIVYAGLAATVLLFWITARLRGATWTDWGVRRPESWLRTVGLALVVSLGVFIAVRFAINPIADALGGTERDMSMYSHLTNSVPTLLINLPLMWITAGFMEELLWRGYLMKRLVDVQGKESALAWAIALAASAAIFGMAHLFQGPVGMFRTGAIGLVFGVAYLAVGRNLWPLILSHALIDTLDFIGHYFGN